MPDRERPGEGKRSRVSDGKPTRRTSRREGRSARRPVATTSWDPLATWYHGWVGEAGSEHHRQLAVPAIMRLLDLGPGERLLDVGCGQGVLAPHVTSAGAK